MQDLDSQIRAAIRRLGITNGTVVDSLSNLVPILSVLLTLVITVATVLTGLDDSSGDADGDTPQPVVNEQMRTDLLRAINYHRDIPVDFDLELHVSAQRQAVVNATAGDNDVATADSGHILMLQAYQHTDRASVDDFLELWRQDRLNYDALMHPDNREIGVGVAEAAGTTYAVVQFRQL